MANTHCPCPSCPNDSPAKWPGGMCDDCFDQCCSGARDSVCRAQEREYRLKRERAEHLERARKSAMEGSDG